MMVSSIDWGSRTGFFYEPQESGTYYLCARSREESLSSPEGPVDDYVIAVESVPDDWGTVSVSEPEGEDFPNHQAPLGPGFVEASAIALRVSSILMTRVTPIIMTLIPLTRGSVPIRNIGLTLKVKAATAVRLKIPTSPAFTLIPLLQFIKSLLIMMRVRGLMRV